MANKCSPPKTVSVKPYDRAKRRKKAKPSTPKAGTVYWVVRNSRTGRTTGVKHRTYSAAINARRREDLLSYRRGQGRPWDTEKVTV